MQHKLSVYLIKSSFNSHADVIKNSKLEPYTVTIASGIDGHFYFHSQPGKRPAWYKLLDGSICDGFDPDKLSTRTISAVLFLTVDSRIYAITFGYGKSLIKSDSYEERFGLKVCMNSIDPEKFRVIERKKMDTMLAQNRTQMNQKCSINEFALDIYNILLKAVTGDAKDENFAKRISGADSLSVVCDLSLQDLPAKCKKLYDAYVSTDYKTNYPWMDNLREVPKSKIPDLEEQLLELLKAQNEQQVYLAIPEMIEWSSIAGFRFDDKEDSEAMVDILIQDYYESVRSIDRLSLNMLKTKHVYGFDSQSGRSTKEWSIFRCLNCEIDDNGNHYILTEGKWFEVASSFVAEINSRISGIRIYAPSLLDAQNNEKEHEYNTRLSKSLQNACCMDGKNIQYGGGNSKIELCDVFTADNELFHIKRYSGSSVLSHLFNQGINSARLLLYDSEFRKKANEKLPNTHQLSEDAPRASDYSIIYGIISIDSTKLLGNLPFFSKLTLSMAATELQNIGIDFYVAKIQSNAANM